MANSAPVPVVTRPPNPVADTYAYDHVNPETQTEVFKGFGIANNDTLQTEFMNKFDSLLPTLHADFGKPNPQLGMSRMSRMSRMSKAERAGYGQQVFDALPLVPDAPEPWKTKAISKLITDSNLRLVRAAQRKAERDAKTAVKRQTLPSRKPSQHKRKKPSGRTDQDSSDDNSFTLRIAKRSMSRTPTLGLSSQPMTIFPGNNDAMSNGNYSGMPHGFGGHGSLGNFSGSLPGILAPDPFIKPDDLTLRIALCAVQNGGIVKTLAEVTGDALTGSSTSGRIQWSALLEEADSVSDVDRKTFLYDSSARYPELFFSPRPRQEVAVRTSGQMKTALADFRRGSTVYLTTFVVTKPITLHESDTSAIASIEQDTRHNEDASQRSNYNSPKLEDIKGDKIQANQSQPVAGNERQVAHRDDLASERSISEREDRDSYDTRHGSKAPSPEANNAAAELPQYKATANRDAPPPTHDDDAQLDAQELATLPPQVSQVAASDDTRTQVTQEEQTDAAAAFARERLSAAGTAHEKAQKMGIEEWQRAADTFLTPLQKLQLKGGECRVHLSPKVGLNPDFEPMPLQMVGSVELIRTAQGPRGGALLIDKMGLGKSIACVMAYYINLAAVAKIHGTTKANEFPPLHDDRFFDIKPQIGATFLQASAQGIAAIPEAFAKIFADSKFLRENKVFRPKLVILHPEGKKIAESLGGEKNGIFYKMAQADWNEVNPRPDWDSPRVRRAYHCPGYESNEEQWEEEWETEEVPCYEGATVEAPAPSSTRYLIVSTSGCWTKNISKNFSRVEENKAEFKALQKTLDDLEMKSPHATKKIANAKTAIQRHKNNWMRALNGFPDGSGPLQALRRCISKGPGGKMRTMIYVIDIGFAGWIWIDELHAAGSANTIIYTQIVDYFLETRPKSHRPGIVGISGTALANGIDLVLTFADKVIARLVDRKSKDEGARLMASLCSQHSREYQIAWQTVLKIFTSQVNHKDADEISPIAKMNGALEDPKVDKMFSGFAALLEWFCIGRDYASKDPWGNQLNIVDAKHTIQYLNITHEPRWFNEVKKAENAVQAAVKQKYKDDLDAWEQLDDPTIPKPSKVNMQRANPAAYTIARLVSCFPNLLNAIDAWDKANPEAAVFAKGRTLGKDNKALQSALVSEQSIRDSFIWRIAKNACKGSAKIKHIKDYINQLRKERSEVTHPILQRAKQGEKFHYKSKYIVVTSMRLARALLWTYLCQTFQDRHVCMASGSSNRAKSLAQWRTFYDPSTDRADDDVFILVAGLRVISQSVTLVEGHVLEGLDLPLSIHDAQQVANRQFRVGQQHDEVFVNWLITHDSELKYRTIDDRIAARTKAKQTFLTTIQSRKTGDADKNQEEYAVIDLTGED
ncbi:hypothetical protein Alg215_11433 [Pyrenophora tritici-repentis]|nr:hypothetical protein Alg215_11433 [Pyrenophora tritici-repentis]